MQSEPLSHALNPTVGLHLPGVWGLPWTHKSVCPSGVRA